MKFKFLEMAQVELDQAIAYYNSESPGLGEDFLDEVVKALKRIGEHPEAWHLRPHLSSSKRWNFGCRCGEPSQTSGLLERKNPKIA